MNSKVFSTTTKLKKYISSSFLNINCQFPGSTHDVFIFANSQMKQIMEHLPQTGKLLGDSGYPLRDYIMTPFNTPATPTEERFNNAHTRTRNVVERAFGVLKSRFGYLCLYKFNYLLLYLLSNTVMYCTFEWEKFFYDIYLFKCLHNRGGYLPLKPEKCSLVIQTCMRLHNKAISEKVPLQQGEAIAVQHIAVNYNGAAPQSAELRQQIAARF